MSYLKTKLKKLFFGSPGEYNTVKNNLGTVSDANMRQALLEASGLLYAGKVVIAGSGTPTYTETVMQSNIAADKQGCTAMAYSRTGTGAHKCSLTFGSDAEALAASTKIFAELLPGVVSSMPVVTGIAQGTSGNSKKVEISFTLQNSSFTAADNSTVYLKIYYLL